MRASTTVLSTLLPLVLLTGASADAVPVGPVPPPAPSATPDAGLGTDPLGVWPLRPDPVVVHGFDPPATAWGAGHRGVDLLARPGQPVRAALPGTVTYAGVLAGRGVLVVSHGATRTTYEPVEASVVPGTVVEAGDRLGTVQAAPSHCAPRSCLHWGWVEGETYLDPLRLVGLGPVRLLPYLSITATGGSGTAGSRHSWPVTTRSRAAMIRPPVPAWW